MCDCLICSPVGNGRTRHKKGSTSVTWHFALFSSNLVSAWKFFAGMFGAFFKQINALHQGQATTKTWWWHKIVNTWWNIQVSYLVLQGFPTTKTFTFREATALSAFPWHNSKFQIITRIQLLCRFFVHFTQIYTWFLVYAHSPRFILGFWFRKFAGSMLRNPS